MRERGTRAEENKTHAREKNKTVESVARRPPGRAREFRVNELICIENEDLDDDGGWYAAPDDDRDDARRPCAAQECEASPRAENSANSRSYRR